jgi:hypothetical protein
VRFTYKVQAKKDKTVFFVSQLRGPNNETDYRYIGVLSDDGKHFHHSHASRVTPEAQSFRVFAWFVDKLARDELHPDLEVWATDRCCACGRTLSDPESIADAARNGGFGPECRKYRRE